MSATASPAAPSRQFMVAQATLTALHATYPHTIRVLGRTGAADRLRKVIEAEFGEAEVFAASVKAEYRALASQYQGAN